MRKEAAMARWYISDLLIVGRAYVQVGGGLLRCVVDETASWARRTFVYEATSEV